MIKQKLETKLSAHFRMTDNGINDTGITLTFFEDESQIDFFYSDNDAPIEQIKIKRDDLSDEQAIELCFRAFTALVTTDVRGDALQYLVDAMRVDVMYGEQK